MASRKSVFQQRLRRIRGVTPAERDLLLRLGEVIDGAVNNRGPSNPGISGLRKIVRKKILPPPRNLNTESAPLNGKVEWDPVDSPILNFYEAEIIDTSTNLSQFKLSFTNRVFLPGPGTFTVRVRSVARDGTCSPFSDSVTVEITEAILFLEGNKRGVEEIERVISEDIFTPEGYKLFTWGAYNLNDFATVGANNRFFFDLSRSGFYPIISRLIMPGESETLVNLTDGSFVVPPTRPGLPDRGSNVNLESPAGAMFLPVDITSQSSFKDQLTEFFLFNDRDDAAGLSETLFAIPGAITEVEEDELNIVSSYRVGDLGAVPVDDLDFTNSNSQPFNLYSPEFTLGMWIKWESALSGTNNSDSILDLTSLSDVARVRFNIATRRVGLAGFPSPSPGFEIHILSGAPAGTSGQVYALNGTTNSFNLLNAHGKWHFMVVRCFPFGRFATSSPQLRTELFINNNELISSTNLNNTNGTHTWPGSSVYAMQHTGFNSSASQSEIKVRIYYLALWDIALTDSEIAVLTNNPQEDISFDFGGYEASGNLIHYWRVNPVGLDPSDIILDSGNTLPKIIISEDQPQVWVDNSPVLDIPTAAGQP